MTTNDLQNGRSAATRRPTPGALRFLCFGLLCAAALPAFAQKGPAATATGATVAAASIPATATLTTMPATSDAMPLPDRSALFAGDISRMVATQPAPASAEAASPTAGSRIQSVLQRALALLGTPYRWGGTTTSGFDCSGLVGYVFRSTLGIELPRVSRDMASSGTPVAREALTPGDLVFFGVHHGRRVDHVGIYMGEGRFLHAPRTGRDVTVSSLDDGYWSGKFLQARRVSGI